MSVLSADEDWSIISSSDMDDQSTTSSVHYEENDSVPPDSQTGPDSVLDSQNTITGEPKKISYFDNTVDANGHVTCVMKRRYAVEEASEQQEPLKVLENATGGEKGSFLEPLFRMDRYLRGLSSSFYSHYFKKRLRKLQVKIQTPSVRYKVTNWANVISVTNPENFCVKNEDLYFHERVILMAIDFLNSQEQLLVYWLLAYLSLVLTAGTIIAVGGFPSLTSPDVAPPSISSQISSLWDRLVYEKAETVPNSWFSAKKAPVKVMRFSKEWDTLRKQGSEHLSAFERLAAVYGDKAQKYYFSVLPLVVGKVAACGRLASQQFLKATEALEASRNAVSGCLVELQPHFHALVSENYAAGAKIAKRVSSQLQISTALIVGSAEEALVRANAFISKREPQLQAMLEFSKNKVNGVSILAYQQAKPLVKWVEKVFSAW